MELDFTPQKYRKAINDFKNNVNLSQQGDLNWEEFEEEKFVQ
jgi:hypothetical protein